MCGQRPTRALLDFVGDNLLAKLTWLEGQSEESEGGKHHEQLSNGGSQLPPRYNVVKAPEEAAIIVNVDGKNSPDLPSACVGSLQESTDAVLVLLKT